MRSTQLREILPLRYGRKERVDALAASSTGDKRDRIGEHGFRILDALGRGGIGGQSDPVGPRAYAESGGDGTAIRQQPGFRLMLRG